MNRKNLTAAVLAGLAGAAGIAGTAQAVNLNPDGLGQVLIYPYYTTNDGNATLLSVVNTTDAGKAVKVRFKEGYNSREVLDFNLYLSAWDVWVAAIVDGGAVEDGDEGVPTLLVNDSSCTVPYLYGDGGVQEFLPYDYSGSNNDGGPDEDVGDPLPRASEGYFEMIEMGTVEEDSDTEEAITHLASTGEPKDCEELVDNWTRSSGGDGKWIPDPEDDPDDDDEDENLDEVNEPAIDIGRNSGGLFGGAAIIHVATGTMESYDAKAIQGFDKAVDGVHLHEEPGTSEPSLNSGDQASATLFFGVPQDEAVDLFYDSSRPVDAISALFMHEYTMNEYNIETSLEAASEWIITFPTKAWYVNEGTTEYWRPDSDDPGCGGWEPGDEPYPTRDGPDYTDSVNTTDTNPANGIPDVQEDWVLCSYIEDSYINDAVPPFTSIFDGEACEYFGIQSWDREESPSTPPPGTNQPPIVSPPPPPPDDPDSPSNALCYEVNVLRFGDNSVFGTDSDLLYTYEPDGEAGWARISWYSEGADVNEDEIEDHVDYAGLVGLPVTGFWATELLNTYVGVGASYGGIFQHKGNVRRISNVQ